MERVVCHCKVVSDREIKSVIKKGALSIEEIMEFTGAGTGCGRCRPQLADLLIKHQNKTEVVQLRLPLFEKRIE